ncbi:FGGY-family carbohydrate kinase [Devosia sp. ZB163]|uniref:FGGY-family carbohydrate kinase n=1 Tax=Devosia sp. ZB163 TaxID=3025938 RepID=UPI003FCEC441
MPCGGQAFARASPPFASAGAWVLPCASKRRRAQPERSPLPNSLAPANLANGAVRLRDQQQGGAGKSRLVRQLLADASGLPVVATASPEPVLLGSAMLGASAAGAYASLIEAMSAMSSVAEVITPDEGLQAFHHRRFAAFRKLQLLAGDIRQGS